MQTVFLLLSKLKILSTVDRLFIRDWKFGIEFTYGNKLLAVICTGESRVDRRPSTCITSLRRPDIERLSSTDCGQVIEFFEIKKLQGAGNETLLSALPWRDC